MKTLLFFAAVGGGIALWKYHAVPSIKIKSVDWNNLKVVAVVRGKDVQIDAGEIFRTSSALTSPIFFNKYAMTAERNQTNIGAPAVLRIAITEGNTLVGQSVYVDFDSRNIEGQ